MRFPIDFFSFIFVRKDANKISYLKQENPREQLPKHQLFCWETEIWIPQIMIRMNGLKAVWESLSLLILWPAGGDFGNRISQSKAHDQGYGQEDYSRHADLPEEKS